MQTTNSPAATMANITLIALFVIFIRQFFGKGTNIFPLSIIHYLFFYYLCTQMIGDELKYRILQSFAMMPTAEQSKALDVFTAFMADRREQVVMILRGSAGTGKTTLAGAMVRALVGLRQKMILMAPTGRAAKASRPIPSTAGFTVRKVLATSVLSVSTII